MDFAGRSAPQPGLETTAGRLATPLATEHPLSPHIASLHPITSRRSPSSFTMPLLDDAGPASVGQPGYDLPRSSGTAGDVQRVDTNQLELLGDGSSRSSPKKTGPSRDGRSRASLALDSPGKVEMEVVRRRYDMMDDGEIRRLLADWDRGGAGGTAASGTEANEDNLGSVSAAPFKAAPAALAITSSSRTGSPTHFISKSLTGNIVDPQSPLFPPSPPSLEPKLADGLVSRPRSGDHPLRILARAVLELRDTVERLQAENEALRADIEGCSGRRYGAGAAISTSLTTTAPTPPKSSFQSDRFPDPPRVPSPAPSSSSNRPPSIRSHHRKAASIRSVDVRASSSSGRPSSTTGVLPSDRSGRSIEIGEASASPGRSPTQGRKRDAARGSWTASIWGWGGGSGSVAVKKGEGDRKESVSSGRGEAKGDDLALILGEEEEDEHVWRMGDGGSSPAFRAVFLATRLVTPDPSSILSPATSPTNLISTLAHSLVSNARDQGVVARDPPHTNRRLSKEGRSRAASVLSQEGQKPGDGTREKTYGETLAATALYGRALLSTVSGSTIRAEGRSKAHTIAVDGDETIRPPSLLSRTSARTFPTTALSPSAARVESSGSGRAEGGDDDGDQLPSVEMASMVAGENQAPTVLLSRRNLGLYFQAGKEKGRRMETATRFKGIDPPLTDRYGFIYDIQHASMLKDASAAGVPAPASLSGVIPGAGRVGEGEGWIERRRRASHEPSRPDLDSGPSTGSGPSPSPAAALDDLTSTGASGISTPSRTPSSSLIPLPSSSEPRHRSSTLVNLNPSPVRPVTAKNTLTVSARGASSLRSVASPSSALLAPSTPPDLASTAVSRATISSLLDQLTELHDRQQAERKVEWDSWLNKRKRKRAASMTKAKGETGWGGDMIGISQMGLGDAEEWRAFARLVRHGIPLAYRSDIWAECSGAKDALVPGEYREILAVHAQDPSPVLADIEKDVSRTFPGNMFFGGDGPGVAKLRRVLVAYSWRNPRIGYCQGLNMLAATLLLVHTDEEQAFWVLAAMVDRLLPADFYSPSLLASRADQAVLAELVELHLPRISARLGELGVDLASITFGWFLSLFTDCLPVETLFRVWDVFFVEGHDTLFRVALAIVKLNEAEICAAESAGDLFTFLAGMTSRLWAADKLVLAQHGYRPLVRHTDIAVLYAKHLASLQE